MHCCSARLCVYPAVVSGLPCLALQAKALILLVSVGDGKYVRIPPHPLRGRVKSADLPHQTSLVKGEEKIGSHKSIPLRSGVRELFHTGTVEPFRVLRQRRTTSWEHTRIQNSIRDCLRQGTVVLVMPAYKRLPFERWIIARLNKCWARANDAPKAAISMSREAWSFRCWRSQ